MRFSTTAGNLKDAVSQVRSVVPSNPSYVAYSGVLIYVLEGGARLTGSDGESYYVALCEGSTEEVGQALVLPKPLAAFLATVPSKEEVTLSTADNGDVQVGRKGKEPYSFRPLSATYPSPPASSTPHHEVDLTLLSAALSTVRPSVARDTQAVQVKAGQGVLELCSTDTFRLAWAQIPDVALDEATCVLPFGALERIGKATSGRLAIDTTSRLVHFKATTYETSARMLATPFPAVESVLASVPDTACAVSPAELHQAVARLSSVADQAPIRIQLDKSTARLSVSTADLGAGEEEIVIEGGPSLPFEILIKAPYLAESLAAIGGDSAMMHFSGPLQPLFLSSQTPVRALHAIMPVRG